MKPTTPRVLLIASPLVDWEAVSTYLSLVEGDAWLSTAGGGKASDAEALVEFAGRLCYRSWKPGLNPNVTKVRASRESYFANLLSSRHGSVLEHAQFTFLFHSVSRVFTHELVRHRAGVAISQESLRYVRLNEIGFRIPSALAPMRDRIVGIIEDLEEFQRSAAHDLGIDMPDVPFSVKKEVTSALRRLAPMGLSTEILWSANVRTIRHVLEMRTDPGAEEEMRLVFGQVGELIKAACPLLFSDFSVDASGQWVPKYSKV